MAMSNIPIKPQTPREMYVAYLTGRSNIALHELPDPRTYEETVLFIMCYSDDDRTI